MHESARLHVIDVLQIKFLAWEKYQLRQWELDEILANPLGTTTVTLHFLKFVCTVPRGML